MKTVLQLLILFNCPVVTQTQGDSRETTKNQNGQNNYDIMIISGKISFIVMF